MKLFAVNWLSILGQMTVWQRLDPEARRIYLYSNGDNDGVDPAQFDAHLQTLSDAQMLTTLPAATGCILTIHRSWQEFHRLMTALGEVEVFRKPDLNAFREFARQHCPSRFCTSLIEQGRQMLRRNTRPGDYEELFEKVCSEEWVGRLLQLEKAVDFEYAHLNRGERRFFLTPRLLKQTQQLIRTLSGSPQPVPFEKLQQSFARMELPMLLSAGLRYMVFYPALTPDTLEPVLGLWPRAVERINAPSPQQPASVEAEQEFCSPFLLDDMVKVLVGCSSTPLRLRSNDGRLFARQQEELESRLTPLPGWLEEVLSFDAAQRLGEAFVYLENMGFLDRRGRPGRDLRMEVNAQGAEWLSQTAQQRLQGLLDQVRADGKGAQVRPFLPWEIDILSSELDDEPDLDEAVAGAYRSLSSGEFYAFHPFGLYHRVNSNPLLELRKRSVRFALSLVWKRFDQLGAERLEQIWYNLLLEFLRQRLIPLGGVRVGHTRDGQICFALNGAGLYFLGETDRLDCQEAVESQILVQPNFEIVFLTPAPLAEAEIGRFARRAGRDVGVMFKLTKASVTAAVGTGMNDEQILRTLRQLSSRQIPPNVEKEIRSWAGQCRRIRIEPAVLIRCPDPETAGRVQSLGGKNAQLLNESTVELKDPKAKKSLLNKLRKEGVFPEL